MEPVSLRVNDAAKAVGVSRSKFYELIRDGVVDAVTVGGRTLIPVESIRSLVANAPRLDLAA
jgi:excisionase family DNA binding protein